MTWKPDYITSALLKSELHMDAGDTADDAQIARWVTAASRAVDDWTHRQFGKLDAPATWTYEAVWDRHECAWFAIIDDITSTTGLSMQWRGSSTALAADDYTLLPRDAVDKGMAYEQIKITGGASGSSLRPLELEVTATFGWQAVPAAIAQATMLQALRLEARRSSPFGVAGSPSEGSEIRLSEKIDVDARSSARPYRREWWTA